MGMSMKLHTKWRPWLLLFVVAALAPALAYPAWRHLYPVLAAPGWDYRVFHDGIERVSALVREPRGALFISQEFADGQGTILRRRLDGRLEEVLHGLAKPDGLALYRDGVALSQEGGRLPVLLLHGEQSEPLFSADNVEGIASDGHYLYAIEDKKLGRLLRYDPTTGEVLTLRDGLDQGEAVTVCADGRLFYTEKRKGWVKQWQAGGADQLVQANLHEPGFLLCNADGLWISEDSTHMARLLLLDPAGQLQVVLQHLRSAQSIIALEPGHYLLAEQGRNRILELTRLANGA